MLSKINAALGVGMLGLALLGATSGVEAGTILVFGQDGLANTITATPNGAQTATTISGTDIAITISAIDAPNSTPLAAFFTLSATSFNSATMVGANVTQRFNGSFSIRSATGGGGTNFLSGTFTDSVFGAGTGLTLTASDATPGESVVFTSDVIANLFSPRSINLAFSAVTPPVSIVGSTLGGFTASVAGNFSAEVIPEPGTLAMAFMALPLLGLGYYRRHRSRA